MIISVTNLKGGVGKSTIARNIAVHFARRGAKVCILDTDTEQRTTCDWWERRSGEDTRVDVFPMSTVDGIVNDVKTHRNNGYSVIVIDGVPQLEIVTTRIILLSNLVLIPITPSIDDLKSFERFLTRYMEARAILSGSRELYAFVVLNKYSGRNNEDLEMKEALKVFAKSGILTLKSTIADRVSHKRASKYGLTALEWPADQIGQLEISRFCQEVERTFINLMKREV